MTKHWFIGHLIQEYSKGKSFGLDIGVGKDNWKEFKKCKFIGIDKIFNKNPNFVVDLENTLPFKDEVFDIVIAINSLNYIENGRQLLTEINRVMTKNAVMVCIVDNEKSKSQPNVWEQRYLDRLLTVTGFKHILKNNLKDFLYARWYNRTSVYAFSVAKKEQKIKETRTQECFKCGKILGKHWKVDEKTKELYHITCPVSKADRQWARSYNVQTTHPEK